MTLRASIVGGSGYAGGELLRLLLGHPGFDTAQVTSRRLAGSFVHFTHPNLRGHTDLRFSTVDELEPCDLLFLCLPHGNAAAGIALYSELAPKIVDLSADFRLRSPAAWEKWYGSPHPAPEWLARFVYGLPELDHEAAAAADRVSGVGCNATATLLGLLPLLEPEPLKSNLVDWRTPPTIPNGPASCAASGPPATATRRRSSRRSPSAAWTRPAACTSR